MTNRPSARSMPHPLEVFDKIFVINLATRDDRRREMDEQFRRIGIPPDAPLVEFFSAVRPENPGPFPSVGARGCFMSHLGVLKAARDRRLERILIVEDDVNFSQDFKTRINGVSDRLRRDDWSMFYGGYRLDCPIPAADGACAVLPAVEGIQTAHLVGFRARAIDQVVNYLEQQLQRLAGDRRGGPMHVDGSYTWFRRDHPSLLTLLAVPELGDQRASRTDIHALGLRDRLPILRTAMAAMRQLKNRINH